MLSTLEMPVRSAEWTARFKKGFTSTNYHSGFIHSFIKKKSLSTHNNPETIISIKDITGNEANENPFVYEISSGDSVPFGLLGA